VNSEWSLSVFLQLSFEHVSLKSWLTLNFSNWPSGRCGQTRFWISEGIRWSSGRILWNCRDFGTHFRGGFQVHYCRISLIWRGRSCWRGGCSLAGRTCRPACRRCRSEGWRCTRNLMIHTANLVANILGHQAVASWQIEICYSESSLVGPSLLSNLDTAPVSFSLRTLGRCLLGAMVDVVTCWELSRDVLGIQTDNLYRIHAFMQGFTAASLSCVEYDGVPA